MLLLFSNYLFKSLNIWKYLICSIKISSKAAINLRSKLKVIELWLLITFHLHSCYECIECFTYVIFSWEPWVLAITMPKYKLSMKFTINGLPRRWVSKKKVKSVWWFIRAVEDLATRWQQMLWFKWRRQWRGITSKLTIDNWPAPESILKKDRTI